MKKNRIFSALLSALMLCGTVNVCASEVAEVAETAADEYIRIEAEAPVIEGYAEIAGEADAEAVAVFDRLAQSYEYVGEDTSLLAFCAEAPVCADKIAFMLDGNIAVSVEVFGTNDPSEGWTQILISQNTEVTADADWLAADLANGESYSFYAVTFSAFDSEGEGEGEAVVREVAFYSSGEDDEAMGEEVVGVAEKKQAKLGRGLAYAANNIGSRVRPNVTADAQLPSDRTQLRPRTLCPSAQADTSAPVSIRPRPIGMFEGIIGVIEPYNAVLVPYPRLASVPDSMEFTE